MALINKCIESKIEVIALVNPDSRRSDRIPKDPLVRVIKCGLDDLAEASAKSLGIGETEPGGGTFADAFIHLAWGGTLGIPAITETYRIRMLHMPLVRYGWQGVWDVRYLSVPALRQSMEGYRECLRRIHRVIPKMSMVAPNFVYHARPVRCVESLASGISGQGFSAYTVHMTAKEQW